MRFPIVIFNWIIADFLSPYITFIAADFTRIASIHTDIKCKVAYIDPGLLAAEIPDWKLVPCKSDWMK